MIAISRTAETTARQRTIARRAAGLSRYDSRPVIVVEGGHLPPKQVGHSYYHTTPSGKTIVHSPGAYGWRTVYHPSTRRVVVGSLWLAENAS